MSEKFAAAAKAGLCNFLSVTGSAAASYAAFGLFTPGPFDEWASLGYAAVAGLAYSAGCPWDPSANGSTTDGCTKVDGGFGVIQLNEGNGWADLSSSPSVTDAVEILITEIQVGTNGGYYPYCNWRRLDGSTSDQILGPFQTLAEAQARKWRIRVTQGTCANDKPPTPPPGPYTHTDPNDGCQLTVNFQGYMATPEGNAGTVWKIEPAGPASFAGGGIIGGCNFEPVVYYQPPGGPGYYAPWLPGPDGEGGEPWWAPIVRGLVGGATSAIVNRIMEGLFGEKAQGRVYRLVSVCETNDQGEPVSLSREVSIPDLPLLNAAIYRLDAIEYLLQGLKDFKQPICPPERPKLLGDWVTVNFVSDEKSPGGEKKLRKHLRYRDLSGAEHLAHVHHWEDFTWEAGPVIVVSRGLSWGEPKVWAATEAEGKRVIAHAAAVSGVDLTDPRHEWLVTGSSDARFGQLGTMRVQRRNDGWIRVSKRDGPSGLPKLYGPPAHS